MADYPYTQVSGKIRLLFDKVQQTGVPANANQSWLKSIGFNGSNDRTLFRVLKGVGFIDGQGKPTSRWTQYRDKAQSKSVLGEGIRDGYSDLFNVYEDANTRSEEDIRNFFRARTNSGDRAVQYMVLTFKALCGLADFAGSAAAVSREADTQPEPQKEPANVTEKMIPRQVADVGSGITLNINIQLTVPDTTDETVYDNFFAALKRHLINR